MIKSDKDCHTQVFSSPDFYNLSELKDLLFHVQEHRFTIPKIKDHLDKLGLKFCGFEKKQMVSHFTKINKTKDDPYDLYKWQAYEKANSQVFAAMYQFWCQKIEWKYMKFEIWRGLTLTPSNGFTKNEDFIGFDLKNSLFDKKKSNNIK